MIPKNRAQPLIDYVESLKDRKVPLPRRKPEEIIEEEETVFEPHGPGGAGTRIPKEMVEGRAPYNELFEMVKGRAVSPQLDEFEPAGPGGAPYDKVAITGILEAINNPRGGRQNLMLPKELRGMEDFELRDLMETIKRNRGWKSSKIKRGPRVSDPRAGSYQQGGLISLAKGNQVGEELMESLQGGRGQGTDLTVFDEVISEPVRQDSGYRPSQVYDPGRASFEEYKQTLGESKDYLTDYGKSLITDREAASKRRAGFDKRRMAAEEEAQRQAEQSRWLLLAQAFSKFGSDADPTTGIIGKLAKHGGEAIGPLMELRSDEAARKAQSLIGEEERMIELKRRQQNFIYPFVLSFAFEKGEHKGESYKGHYDICSNPLCTCQDVQFIVESTDEGSSDKKQWTNFQSAFYSYKAHITKNCDIQELNPRFSVQEVEQERLMAGYQDIFPYGEDISFIEGDIEYFFDDQYCINPNCSCRDVALVIVPIRNGKVLDENESPAVRYDYKTKKWRPEKTSYPDTIVWNLSIRYRLSMACQ